MAVTKPIVHHGRDSKINFRVTKSNKVVRYKAAKASNKIKNSAQLINGNIGTSNGIMIGGRFPLSDDSSPVVAREANPSLCSWTESLPKHNSLTMRDRKDSVLSDSATPSEGPSPRPSVIYETHKLPSASTESLELISQRNATESPLLSLPLQVRQKIYRYVFLIKEYRVHVRGCTPICIAIEDVNSSLGDKGGKSHRELLSVCKQIHFEAALLPVRLNTFYVLPHLALRWLETEKFTTAQEDAISILRVNFLDVQHRASFLKYFYGVRKVYVSWAPDNRSRQELKAITSRLRVEAGKKNVEVVFLHND